MHELSLCLNIIKILEEQAVKYGLHKINFVWIEAGELAAVEIKALELNFYLAVKETIAKDAKLKITTIDGTAYCDNCKSKFKLQKYGFPCSACNGYDYQIISGTELLVRKMEAE